MLDHISIFSQTGLVLWSRSFCKIKGDPVNDVIKTVLIEERGGDKTASFDRYTLKWTLANELSIVFVVVYQKILQILYVEELLEKLKHEFLRQFESVLKQGMLHTYDFDKSFDRILREVETEWMVLKKQTLKKQSGSILEKHQTKDRASKTVERNLREDCEESEGSETAEPADDDASDEPRIMNGRAEEEAFRQQALERLQSRHLRNQTKKTSGKAPTQSKVSAENSSPPSKSSKKPTVWYDGKGKISSHAKAALDYSKEKGTTEIGEDQLQEMKLTYLPEDGEIAQWEEEENEGSTDASEGVSEKGWGFSSTFVGSFFQSLMGNKILTNEDLSPIIDSMRENLIAKNVASEIADEICRSVRNKLEGQRLASFTRIKTMVQQALEQAVTQVLTPKKPTDLLREIFAAKKREEPYSIVFVGVNGVGKSTSLAKVCYYLKQHGINVMIAACDTFRSGAVEQLNVHATCLDVPLFEKGYARDPASVAGAAIKHAKDNGIDCVLIDTAGRMQNNVPLMRALSKLICDNDPDLVLFVGEALVGNDGIDQLKMFNQSILSYSPPGKHHQIDGIVLTKFDTIDTKVGAALSMAYNTGQPIMFVGTGQKYTHLRKLNVQSVMKALFT